MRRRTPAGPGRIPHIPVPPECREMIRRGALFALNHSGGKDSQAMTILLARIVPRQNLLAVHAALERRIGHTLSPSRIPLPELTGAPAEAGQTPFGGVSHAPGYRRDRACRPHPDRT